MIDTNVEFGITGIVVTLNEEKYLAQCLGSLSFCHQLIVVDLGSTDGSIEIAKRFDAEIIPHEKRPIVEQIIPAIIPHAGYDWIVKIDPDEIFSQNLLSDVNRLMADPNVGQISVPFQFYFRRKPIDFSFWGMIKNKPLIFNKHRVRISPLVHEGITLMEDFTTAEIPRTENNFVIHYWMDSYMQLFEKHNRYVVFEGESRFNRGERFAWNDFFVTIVRTLLNSLFRWNGLKGGWEGVFLSFFYTWYILRSLLSLRKYQKSRGAHPAA